MQLSKIQKCGSLKFFTVQMKPIRLLRSCSSFFVCPYVTLVVSPINSETVLNGNFYLMNNYEEATFKKNYGLFLKIRYSLKDSRVTRGSAYENDILLSVAEYEHCVAL